MRIKVQWKKVKRKKQYVYNGPIVSEIDCELRKRHLLHERIDNVAPLPEVSSIPLKLRLHYQELPTSPRALMHFCTYYCNTKKQWKKYQEKWDDEGDGKKGRGGRRTRTGVAIDSIFRFYTDLTDIGICGFRESESGRDQAVSCAVAFLELHLRWDHLESERISRVLFKKSTIVGSRQKVWFLLSLHIPAITLSFIYFFIPLSIYFMSIFFPLFWHWWSLLLGAVIIFFPTAHQSLINHLLESLHCVVLVNTSIIHT